MGLRNLVETEKGYWIAAGANVMTNSLDALTTMYSANKYSFAFQELNPIMNELMENFGVEEGLFLAKSSGIILTMGMTYFANCMCTDKIKPGNILLYLAAALTLIPTINNLYEILTY